MDLKTEIFRIQRAIEENPAIVALVIFGIIGVIFVLVLLFEGVIRRWRKR
jgi:hypothetical protein